MSEPIAPKLVVLAAVDLREGASGVLARSFEMAVGHPHVELHVLAVREPSSVLWEPDLLGWATTDQSGDLAALAAFVKARMDEALARRPSALPGHVVVHAVAGSAADEIVWLAAHLDADIVVVGTHGRRGVKRLLLGSVAEKVVRLAGCPVVVAREKHHDASWKLPEIEPICPDCASARATSGGATLWCERHSIHHVRAHVVSTGGGSASLRATESMFGT